MVIMPLSAKTNKIQLLFIVYLPATASIIKSYELPAAGVTIKLEKYNEATKVWSFVDEKATDHHGRITDFLSNDSQNRGIYKLTYYTEGYFRKTNTESFYPFIEVVFQIKDSSHYHVPITLSAYGYSTYRGN